jgi:hypothetical protein
MTRTRVLSLLTVAALVGALAVVGSTQVLAGSRACAAPAHAMRFAPQGYVDTSRAGGEPTVETLPSGTLLYTAHAGTTHFYSPDAGDPNTAAFVRHYSNQTYVWRSTDDGKTWHFVERLPAPSGFSDPEVAVDAAGNVYISEINLVNDAVWKSTDDAKSFELQNFFGEDLTDRQWTEADLKDVLYMDGNPSGGGSAPADPIGNTSHMLFRSTDGGKTFDKGVADTKGGAGLGDLQVDRRTGTVYEAHLGQRTLSMAAFRHARQGSLAVDVHPIVTGVDMLSHWPSFDVDARGNLYITWDETGKGARPAGVYYSFSTDGGRTWAAPVRLDTDDRTDIWPWLAVGAPGRVAFAWLEADRHLPGNDAQTTGSYGWRVMAAQTLNGLGCTGSRTPGVRVVTATPKPIHTGTVCMGGTVCQAQLIDRRLGDFFTIEIGPDGHLWAGYSDTRHGGAVALPGLVRQVGGPSFLAR